LLVIFAPDPPLLVWFAPSHPAWHHAQPAAPAPVSFPGVCHVAQAITVESGFDVMKLGEVKSESDR